MAKSFFMAAAVVCAVCSTASAAWEFTTTGAWPQTWPKGLEPLRKHSSTIRGSQADLIIHHIPFTKRDQFEAAWPLCLAVKTKGRTRDPRSKSGQALALWRHESGRSSPLSARWKRTERIDGADPKL